MQKRNIGLYTKVSEEEKNIIYEKMKSANTNNMRGYFRKMPSRSRGRRGITDSGTDKRWVRQLADETHCDREH